MLSNSTNDANQVEAEREAVLRSQIELVRDQMETTLESCWYTNFRDHQLGQPVRGSKDQVSKISVQDVQDWVSAYCVGKNLVVAVTGAGLTIQIDKLKQIIKKLSYQRKKLSSKICSDNLKNYHYQ